MRSSLRLPFEAFRPGALGAVKLSHRSLRKNKPDRKKRVKEEKRRKTVERSPAEKFRNIIRRVTKDLLKKFKWEVSEHPSYSPNLALCDFQVFGPMKERRALRTGDISSMKIGRGNSYRMLKGSFSTKDMEKFMPLYNKCLNKLSDYVEK
ncbi:hypothetical protein HZH68_007501 [Vespula germanica]|uniref:Uncharacterized protein n=1 Tax=Vespula germanica TaxID=30212 RepID=A0A834K9J7_VESGE|nr:hypothetical protein HZH68_007501 [Vespula germanica]